MIKPLIKVSLFVMLFFLLCGPVSFAKMSESSNDYLNTTQTAQQVKSLQSKVFAQYVNKKETDTISIKILSGTGDLDIAKAMANRLKYMGYDIAAVDFAPRSNFTQNTIYFNDNAKTQAEELASDLAGTRTNLKALSWESQYDIILVATEIPQQTPKKSDAIADGFKIKVLSGDGNISTAKSVSRQLKQMGHEHVSIDYAPRSDFKMNTIYFAEKAESLAGEISGMFDGAQTQIKPLSWDSNFDLIVVTVSGSQLKNTGVSKEALKKDKQQEMAAEREALRKAKQKQEMLKLNETAAILVSEAHGFYAQADYAAAEKKYHDAAALLEKIVHRCTEYGSMPSDETEKLQETAYDYKNIKFQILSKNVDLRPAKKKAGKIKKMGFDIQPVDYALRSDLTNNTLYYHPSYEGLAKKVSLHLDEEPYLKPIRWYSTFDLILVTGDPAERGRAAWLLEKWRMEENELKEKTDRLLSEAASLMNKNDYDQAKTNCRKILPLIERAKQISKKSIDQAAKMALEQTLEQAPELKALEKAYDKTILSLDEAIKIAVTNNATIKEAEENLNSAIEEKKSARAGFFPKGSAEYTYTRLNEAPLAAFSMPPNPFLPTGGTISFNVGSQETYEWNTSLTQPLFTGFALVSQYKMKELGVEIAEIEKDMAVMNLVRDVKKAYFNLLLAKAAEKVAGEAVNNLKSHENDAEQYYKQGMIPYNDLLKSKVALAHVVQQREKALAAVKITKSAINTLLNFDINRELDVEVLKTIPPVAYKLENLLHEAMENRPELKMLHLGVKSLDQGIRLVKSGYYPKIAMVGYYSQTGDNPSATENDYGAIYNSAFILKAQWDFFEGGKTRSDVAKYQYDKKALMKQYEYVENGIQLEVKKAFSDLQVSDKNINTSQKSLTQAKENWRITDLQYKEQIATTTDVLDARTELTQAESNYYSALYGYMVSLAELERAVGKKYPIFEESTKLE